VSFKGLRANQKIWFWLPPDGPERERRKACIQQTYKDHVVVVIGPSPWTPYVVDETNFIEVAK
jgi:hypothetical protein